MKNQLQNLDDFIRHTKTLWKNLRALVKRYPEDKLEPDDKIFNRILTNDWRYFHNFIGPMELRYLQVAKWVGDYRKYHSKLSDFFVYILNAPERVAQLPLHDGMRVTAEECLERLELQCQVLKRWEAETTGSADTQRFVQLRTDLHDIIDAKGMKTVEAEIGINRDTFRDFLSGKTRPQDRTIQKMERYVSAIEVL